MADETPEQAVAPWGMRSTCKYCDEEIRATPTAEFIAQPPGPGQTGGGHRIVDIWAHVSHGHERCTGRDTFAAPGTVPRA